MRTDASASGMRGLMRAACILLFLAGTAGFVGCMTTGQDASYFATPQEAVSRTTQLLRARDWKALARYYDLAGTAVTRAQLLDGSFFVVQVPPHESHPNGLAMYREPFAPGFEFASVEPGEAPDILVVTVTTAIDQGGGMVQRGRSAFRLRRTASGYQLLPSPAHQ